MEIRHIRVRGINLRVGIRPGKGLPFLLFNGIGGSIELLSAFIKASDRYIIIFDAPGAGQSETAKRPYRHRHFARLSARLLDELGIEKVDVLGISWGGMAAQQFARQYADRCRRLVLCATSTGQVMVPGKLEALKNMLSPRRYLDPDFLRSIVGTLYGGTLRNDPDAAMEYAVNMQAPSLKGYYHQLFALTGWTSIHWLHRLKQPTLVIAGKDDPITPQLNAHLLTYLIPNASLLLMDCGHLFLLTKAKQLMPHIDYFLDHDFSDS
ncbi:MAG: poly(3-hydroxyalkanoate) depolymerase [Pseudomonadales bacterium]